MERAKSYHRRKIVITFFGMILVLALLGVRLTKLMIGDSEYYASLAQDLHERERTIKAQRGRILDRNGVVLADNRTVCTISVIHSQIRDPEQVIKVLTKELKLDETAVRKRVEKVSSIERIAKNVEKEAEPEKDPESMNCKELESEIAKTQKQMKKAAAELDFEKAAELRDRMIMLKKHLQETEE